MSALKPVNLALQGGGSHGAFTWGVLDALLEDGRLAIKAITGASAGAMNAVALADGFMRGGNEGAKRQLETFWREISRQYRMPALSRPKGTQLRPAWAGSNSSGLALWESWARLISPYDANPLNFNPLRDLLDRLVTFQRLRQSEAIRLFISATNVRTGRLRIFENAELNADAVMASACLPGIFQAVEIGGEAYWDGGYLGNPALFPLFDGKACEDTVLVQINPEACRETPDTAAGIANRISEITFNTALQGELRTIALMRQRAPDGDPYRTMHLHRIALEQSARINPASRINTEWDFLVFLRDEGRRAAQKFLNRHFHAIGTQATFEPG